jgi:hypothetical protein
VGCPGLGPGPRLGAWLGAAVWAAGRCPGGAVATVAADSAGGVLVATVGAESGGGVLVAPGGGGAVPGCRTVAEGFKVWEGTRWVDDAAPPLAGGRIPPGGGGAGGTRGGGGGGVGGRFASVIKFLYTASLGKFNGSCVLLCEQQ